LAGGAVALTKADGVFNTNVFSMNRATSGVGGAVWFDLALNQHISIVKNEFSSNTAISGTVESPPYVNYGL